MFIKTDYENYFSVIQESEKQMLDNLTMIIDKISDMEVLKELIKIREDEARHAILADKLFELIE